jgi:hypothetical protein
VGVDVGADPTGRRGGLEQWGADRHETVEEVGVQGVETGLVGVQHGGETVLPADVLDAIDPVVAPGTGLAAHEKHDTPPALLDASLRRR